MGQIRGKNAHIDACNLRVLSSFGTPAAGQHILVSTDNSATADGQGNFDAYVVGNNSDVASILPLHDSTGFKNWTDGTDAGVGTKSNSVYVRYSDGNWTGASAQLDCYSIQNNGYKKVLAFVGSSDNIPAAIAFYSTDTAITAGYMKSASVQFENVADKWYWADVPEGCKLIVITNRNNWTAQPAIWLQSDVVPQMIKEATDAINESLEKELDGMAFADKTDLIYIRYSDGAKVGSGNYFDFYTIKNDNFSRVSAKLACADSTPAAIAFYNTDTISTAGYMKSASIQHKNTGTSGAWFEADVPEGCKLIALTNRDGYLATPEIKLYTTIPLNNERRLDILEKENAEMQKEYDGTLIGTRRDAVYVKYSDGSLVSSGDYFDIYSVVNKGYTKVSAFLADVDTAQAAIAFYNTDTISTAGYMASASVQHKNTGANGGWFDASVPDECKLIVFTNRDGTMANPIIKIYGMLPNDNEARIDVLEEQNANINGDYSETLIATLEVNSNSSNWYADTSTISAKAGDVFKVVLNKVLAASNITSFSMENSTSLLQMRGTWDVINGEVRYYSIPADDSFKFRLSNYYKTGATASIYKVNRPDLMPSHPEIFGNVYNSKLMRGYRAADANIEWFENGDCYIQGTADASTNDFYYYARLAHNNDRVGTKLFHAINPKVRIQLVDTTNYRYYIYVITDLERMTYKEISWSSASDTTLQLFGQAFTIALGTKDGSAISSTAIADSGFSVEILNPYQTPLPTWGQVAKLEKELADIDVSSLETDLAVVNKRVYDTMNEEFMFGCQPCYSHLFIDTIGINDMPAIPCQSIYDVDAAARLGFKYIELNIHTTSDGVPIALHGIFDSQSRGQFGYEFTDVNGQCTDEVCLAIISEKTYAWVAQNVRYKSKYAKHRTTILPLEEILKECKKCGISVMMHFHPHTQALADKYFNNNWIAYGGYRERGFTGTVMHYSSANTEAAVLAECDAVKPPYIHMMTNDAFNTFLNAGTLADIFQKIRLKGCLAGIAGCYHSAEQNMIFFDNGGDVTASAEFVNDFPTGNICNLKGDVSFSDFVITGGTTTDGVLTLATDGTIGTNLTGQVYLGKGSLRLRFNGTLEIVAFGHNKFTGLVLTSDGSTTKWISTYFLEQVPTFTLKANASTQVFMIDYKASKV